MAKKQIEEKPEYRNAKDRVWDAFSDTPRGVLIPWDKFDRVAGFDHLVTANIYEWFVKEMLRKQNKAVATERSVGLKVCTMDQQLIEEPHKRDRRVRNQVKKQLDLVEYVDLDECTPHQRRIHSIQMEKSEREMAHAKRNCRESAALFKPSETNPRRG